MKRKVLVIDDHPIVREGLTQMIDREPDLSVCGGQSDREKENVLFGILLAIFSASEGEYTIRTSMPRALCSSGLPSRPGTRIMSPKPKRWL